MKISAAKRKLALLWFLSAGILFFILFFQTILGRYGDSASEAWSWFLPTIMPTLSLVIGVLAMDVIGKKEDSKEIDVFLFRLSFGISCVYLIAVLLIVVLQPFTTIMPFEVMKQSNLWLGPFQGIVSAAMGAFFVKSSEKERRAGQVYTEQ